MSVCKSCGEFYISKNCPYCKGEKVLDSTSKKSYYIIGALITLTLMVAINFYRNNGFNTNPLIGTWVSTTKLPMFGQQKIEFRPDGMITMGAYAKVNYEIDGNTVIVTDNTGTGAVYRVVDKDTIYSEALGIRSVFKKRER